MEPVGKSEFYPTRTLFPTFLNFIIVNKRRNSYWHSSFERRLSSVANLASKTMLTFQIHLPFTFHIAKRIAFFRDIIVSLFSRSCSIAFVGTAHQPSRKYSPSRETFHFPSSASHKQISIVSLRRFIRNLRWKS